MKTIAIIEDEVDIRNDLLTLVKRNKRFALAGSAGTVAEAIDLIMEKRPDIVLMDIQLGNHTAFDLLKEVATVPFSLIFVTAYSHHAIRAIKFGALDYLLKPVEPKRLADAIQKLHLSESKDSRPVAENTNNSMLTENDQVFVKDGERCWFVKLSDIRLFESVGNYAKVFFGNNKPLILKSLNSLEERLDDRIFFRANRKHIINLRWIEKIEPYFNGGLLLELKGGEKIEVSRRQTVKFKEMMSL